MTNLINGLKNRPEQKRVPRFCPDSNRKSKKPSDHADLFGILMIVDQYYDGLHKSTVAQFMRERIENFLAMDGTSNSNIILIARP